MAGNLLQKAAEAQQRAQSLRLEGQPQGGQQPSPPGPTPQGAPVPGPSPGGDPSMAAPAAGSPPEVDPAALSPQGSQAPPPDEGGGFEGPSFNGEQASPGEQREYERALSALYKVLYENDKTNMSIVQGLKSTPDNKVEPIAKMGALLIQQLDEKVDLDEAVIAQITGDTVDRLIEMAEIRYKAQYSDEDAQRALGATWEAVMMMFGISERDFEQAMSGMSQEDIARGKQVYQQALGTPREGAKSRSVGPGPAGPGAEVQ